MREFDAWGIAMFLHHLDEAKSKIAKFCENGARDEEMEPEAKELFLHHSLIVAQSLAERFELQSTRDRVWQGGGPFYFKVHGKITYQEAHHELAVLRESMESDLEKRSAIFIEPQKVRFVSGVNKAWEKIEAVIPAIKDDATDANNAYLVELNTACIFHLMRVSEHGLRYLAKKLHVTIKKKGKNIRLEFGDWNDVITGIKNKVTAVRQSKHSPKRKQKLEMYSEAADHCEYMKDIWRNDVCHAGKSFNTPQAQNAFERVRDFMSFVITL